MSESGRHERHLLIPDGESHPGHRRRSSPGGCGVRQAGSPPRLLL